MRCNTGDAERMNGRTERNALLALAVCVIAVVLVSSYAWAAEGDSAEVRSSAEGSKVDRDAEEIPEYVLGPGDTFRVRVWGYDNLEQEVFIPPRGVATIYPIGQVKTAGLTASQLDELITNKLVKYLTQKPEVTVVPMTYNHSQIYVLGEVNSPGLYPFQGKMTVLEAVTRAGNPTARSAIQQVRITRQDPSNPAKSKIIIVDLDSVIHKGEASKDIQLRPGDIVYVPDAFSAAQRTNK